MDKEELISIIEQEEAQCIGANSGALAEQRQKALAYYYGEAYGNEVEGRSQVVTTEVKDAIEEILPALMKIFTSGEDIVRFEPQNPDDDAAAAQATDYLNYIFSRENDGFLALYCLFKDALLAKNGFVKVYWEDYQDQRRETYQGLTDMELVQISQDPELELVEHTMVPGPADQTGQPTQLHDAVFKRTKKYGKVCIDPVPPEEVLISRQTPNDITKARFVEHRTKKTLSQIREMGYKIKDDISDYSTNAELSIERVQRDQYDDATAYQEESGTHDPSTKRVWLCEAYMYVDFDGDGIAEYRKITKVGNTILDNVEFDSLPIIGGTAILMPHKYYGLSIFDLIGDIQLQKSVLLRSVFDNTYLANNGQYEVLDGMVNMEDMLTSRPGGIKRVKVLGAIKRIDSPVLGQPAYNLLEYFDRIKQNRTGVMDFQEWMDPDVLNTKATTANIVHGASMQRIELMARLLAEGPVKDMFWKMLELVSKHQQKPKMVKLRGQWVQVDPREWENKFNMTVTVGLGTGNQQTTLNGAMGILQIQDGMVKAGLANRVVTKQNFYQAGRMYAKAVFPKHADSFFTNPATLPPPQPQQDPELLKLQQKDASDKRKLEQRYSKMGMDFLVKQQDRVDEKQGMMSEQGHEMGMDERQKAHEAGMSAREQAHEHVQSERDRIMAASQAIKGEQQAQKEETEMKILGPILEKLVEGQSQTNQMLNQLADGQNQAMQQMQGVTELLVSLNTRKVKKTAIPTRDKAGNIVSAEITEEMIH